MKRKRWGWVVGLTVLGILAGLWIWRFQITQGFYDTLKSERQVQYYDMGQLVPVARTTDALKGEIQGGYSFCVESCQILSYETLLEEWDLVSPLEKELEPEKVALVSVVIRAGEYGCDMSVYDLQLRGMGVSPTVSPELMKALDPAHSSTQLDLAIEEEVRLTLPFRLHREYFSDHAWRDLEDFELSLYATELHGTLQIRRMVKVNG